MIADDCGDGEDDEEEEEEEEEYDDNGKEGRLVPAEVLCSRGPSGTIPLPPGFLYHQLLIPGLLYIIIHYLS